MNGTVCRIVTETRQTAHRIKQSVMQLPSREKDGAAEHASHMDFENFSNLHTAVKAASYLRTLYVETVESVNDGFLYSEMKSAKVFDYIGANK